MKEESFSIAIDELALQLSNQRIEEQIEDTDFSVQSSIFTVGKSNNVLTNQLGGVELTYVDILKDGLNNPYLQINWRLKREDVESGKIVSFAVIRKKIKREDAILSKNLVAYDANAFDKLSRKNKVTGKFSENKKAFNNVKKSLLDPATLNYPLATSVRIHKGTLL